MTTKKAAVIGYPVKHSLSPILHGYWLKKYNIDGEYGLLEVKPEDLEQTLLGLKDNGYVGCNLTIPHKEAAYNFVISASEYNRKLHVSAGNTKAVNTIAFHESGNIHFRNTDTFGFIENIKQSLPDFDFTKGKALVLGAGGASRAVIFGLMEEGVPSIILLNRSKERAENIKKDFSYYLETEKPDITLEVANWEDRNEILADANLLVNTTSLGMKGNPELDIDLEKLPKNALVTDIVYSPIEVDFDNPTFTKLLTNASERGNFVVEGLGMLLYQAVAGFEMWFGVKPEVTEDLRKHVLSHLK